MIALFHLFFVFSLDTEIAIFTENTQILFAKQFGTRRARQGRNKFEKINSPDPVWVANFKEIENADDKELIQRDAFERVTALLDGLKISAFER